MTGASTSFGDEPYIHLSASQSEQGNIYDSFVHAPLPL